MYRIGDVQFETHGEAEDWAHGNVGGVYSIVSLTFCHTCGDWEDDGERCHVCGGYKSDDGEYHCGNKALARIGTPYWKMSSVHPLYHLRCWVFGFPIR